MRTLLTAICILVSLTVYSQSDEKKSAIDKAVELMDNGFPDDVIAMLEKAKKQDPKDFTYDYEIAYAYSVKKDYKSAIESCKRAAKFANASDLCYQMMGNSYDYLGESENAINAYKEGLKRFPDSGRLYLEQGIVRWIQKKEDEAISLFEKGISVDPTYPSNYYNLAKVYLGTTEKAWGMVYGEQFINLERNTERTEKMSKWLYETYKSSIKIKSDSSFAVSFSKTIMAAPNSSTDLTKSKAMFGFTVYEPLLALSIINEKTIDLNSLDKIRTNFIKLYFSRKFEEKFPVALFETNKMILDAGHYEAYNHWLLMKGDEEGFSKWKSANEDKWNKFVEWYNKNK